MATKKTTKKRSPSKRTTKKRTTKTARKSTKKRTTKKTARKSTKKRTTKKTARKSTKKRTTRRAAPKRRPTKRRPRRNPTRSVPSKDAVTFDVGGRPPSPETLAKATPKVFALLRNYGPIRVHKTNLVYYPWLARRAEREGIGSATLLHAVVRLTKSGQVSLFVDDDKRPVMSRGDVDRCPTIGEADELLTWVRLK